MQNVVTSHSGIVPWVAEPKPLQIYETAVRNDSEKLLAIWILSLFVLSEETTAAKEALRKTIVEAMSLAVGLWERTSNKNKLDLAEESRLWTVTTDKETGVSRTQTMDKYLRISALPKNPRIENVLKTARFVLSRYPEGETASELKEKMKQLEVLRRETA